MSSIHSTAIESFYTVAIRWQLVATRRATGIEQRLDSESCFLTHNLHSRYTFTPLENSVAFVPMRYEQTTNSD